MEDAQYCEIIIISYSVSKKNYTNSEMITEMDSILYNSIVNILNIHY